VMRYIEGDIRGIKHSALLAWRGYVVTHKQHRDELDKLEKQVERLLQKHELRLAKYAVAMGEKQGPVLKNMVFTAWRDVSMGEKYLEKEREIEVQLEEMKRLHEINLTRKKEEQIKALAALGLK
ncbi:unnamed protein product, partial [Polarella glacialis]